MAHCTLTGEPWSEGGRGGGGEGVLCWILRKENLISQDPYPFRSLNG